MPSGSSRGSRVGRGQPAGVSMTRLSGSTPLPAAATGRLIYATEGSVVVESGGSAWPLERDRAAWLPAGVDGQLTARVRAAVAIIPVVLPANRAPGPVVVTTLLRALVGRLVADAGSGAAASSDGPLQAALADELNRLPGAPDVAPVVTDARLRVLADRLLQPDGLRMTLATAGREVGMSSRSLSRLVRRETSVSFVRWRQTLHVAAALTQLAQGEPVATVAYAIGYENPSAFIAMFRRVTDMTPSQYARQLQRQQQATRPRRPLRGSRVEVLAGLATAVGEYAGWLSFIV